MGSGENAALVDLKPTGPNLTVKCLVILCKRLYYKLNPRTEERYK